MTGVSRFGLVQKQDYPGIHCLVITFPVRIAILGHTHAGTGFTLDYHYHIVGYTSYPTITHFDVHFSDLTKL